MSTVDRVELGDGVHALRWDGDGPPVLLVHGLDGKAANWLTVGDLLAARGHPVLAIDLPGFGRSPLGRHRSSMTAHADLVARLGGAWADGPVALAGSSMGGVVSVLAAARHPGLARRVVLVASALPRAGTGRLDTSILGAAASLFVPGTGRLVAGSRHDAPPASRVDQLLAMCVAPGATIPPEARAEMIAVAEVRDRRDHVRGWTRSARSLWPWLARRGAFHDHVDAIEADGVLLTGAVDPIIPTSSADAFAARHPDWARIDLPRVGHVPPLEAPLETADAIAG